jgi:hypothetical protein
MKAEDIDHLLSKEQAEIEAQDVCTQNIRQKNMKGGGPPTELLSSCVRVISELLSKAPKWTEDSSRIRAIINSLNDRKANADWPGLERLHGQTIEYTQTASEETLEKGAMVPTPVYDWLRHRIVIDGIDNDVRDVYKIPGDRTHVKLEIWTGVPGEYPLSRVPVAKLLEKYDAPSEIKKLMTKLPPKAASDRVQIEISTDPVDILRKSTGQFWHSCESAGGCTTTGADYSAGNFTDIEQKNAIAIIRKNADIDEHGDWAGRFMLRSCKDDNGNVNVGIEDRVYGGTELKPAAIARTREFLSANGYLGYDYCITPYEYKGYSDRMHEAGLSPSENPIIYGDWEKAIDETLERQIADVRNELDRDGVCRIKYPGVTDKQYYQGNLADLYEKERREAIEECHGDGDSLLLIMSKPSFTEVTNCVIDYDLDTYHKWKEGEDIFQAALEKIRDVFEDEVYLVGAVKTNGPGERQSQENMHLFAPACEAQYNRSPYASEYWPEKMKGVLSLLEKYNAAERESERYFLKREIIKTMNPWNDWVAAVELLDEATARGPFSSEELARYCYEIEAKGSGQRMVSHGNGYMGVGFTSDGRCPLDNNPAIDQMVERCNLRREMGMGNQMPQTEVFVSREHVGRMNQRQEEIRRIYREQAMGLITPEEASALLRQWRAEPSENEPDTLSESAWRAYHNYERQVADPMSFEQFLDRE